VVGRASDSLSVADMERLMPPLIDAWKSQPWDRAMDGESTSSLDDPQFTILPIAMSLVGVASYGKSLFAPYAEGIFEKACTDVEGEMTVLVTIRVYTASQKTPPFLYF